MAFAQGPGTGVKALGLEYLSDPRYPHRRNATEAGGNEMQALCLLAGANSISYGPKLLTTSNPGRDHDMRLLDRLGMLSTS
jgi:hypothetical protein